MSCSEFVGCVDVAIPHSGAHGGHCRPQAARNAFRKLSYGLFFTIWQYRQDDDPSISLFRGDNRAVVLAALAQRDFVNAHHAEFSNLVLLDTPDFDTGARGSYTNREVTRKALEASDILIYIFTNSNYNNRDNMDFISRMLTGIGRRKCFLIYRVYPSFTEQEVQEHAMIVARGIYGDEADRYLVDFAVRTVGRWLVAEVWVFDGRILGVNDIGEGLPLEDAVWPWPAE